MRVILIHANCRNPNAKGDFAFAGNIAKDLVQEIQAQKAGIDVILVSTIDGLPRFESLYGVANANGRITIEGCSVGLSSLEKFDTITHQVIAFIDANRCKFAPADVIKRVLAPESKFLFVGNLNQNDYSNLYVKLQYQRMIDIDQPEVYSFFNSEDICIASAGFSAARIGIPMIANADTLPKLSSSQQVKLPSGEYSFMYLNADNDDVYGLIPQYITLTKKDRYILIGNFSDKRYQVENSCSNASNKFPEIIYYQSVPNITLQTMVANSSSDLVLSTGTTSTLEVMQQGKLPYYQYQSNNTEFINDYSKTLKSYVSSIASTSVGMMGSLMIELADLLFTVKPLKDRDLQIVSNLLEVSALRSNLIEANKAMLQNACGKIAPRLLTFINQPRKTDDNSQLNACCFALRKQGEIFNPTLEQALRRAAAWGRIFELKILIKHIKSNPGKANLSGEDPKNGYTPLFWAVKTNKLDCARVLMEAGVSPELKNTKGVTAVDLAKEFNDEEMMNLLSTYESAKDLIETIKGWFTKR